MSEETQSRLEGCGRKGLISHWGFVTEPLGGLSERWQRVPAGSEKQESKVTLIQHVRCLRHSICLENKMNITDHRVDSFRVDVFSSALGIVILAVCFGSDVKQGFFLGRSSS